MFLIVLSFLGLLSLKLRSRLYNRINQTPCQINIKVIFQSKNCVKNLFRFKGTIPKEIML